MTTTELKEPSTPAAPQNEEQVNSASKTTSTRKAAVRPEFIYDNRDKESFYRDLHAFHDSRNTPLSRLPKINGKEIDLHKLYSEVISRGGWLKVNIKNEWDELLPPLDLPQKCVNASVALKYIYTRCLDKFERVNFLGEDPDRPDEPEEEGRHKKWSAKTFHAVPLTYNYAQHVVPEHLRVLHKFSNDIYKASEYDKLLLSLISPLPNEQDFAINVCTLMANESKHTLKIEHCPKLIDALIAHAGVFCHFTMRDVFVEFYSKIRQHSLQSFWTDCLYNKPQILEMSYDDYFQSPDQKLVDMGLSRPPLRLPNRNYFEDGLAAGNEECRTDFGKLDFLSLGRGLGTHDYVGQRVHQVTSIMRNLSFFEENFLTMAKNRTFIRYLVMCSNVRWGNLHHMALDILGNIGNDIDLCDPTSDELTRCFMSTMCDGLEGQDRGVIISSLEIICKLSQKDTNHEHLLKCLDQKVYNQICLFLTLNDIMLLLYTLECIYALSSLGQKSCNALVQAKGIIDTLISLITVEAQSYGPDGCILMRVVETVPGNMLPMVAQNLANLQNVQQGQLLAQQQQQQQQQAQLEANQSNNISGADAQKQLPPPQIISTPVQATPNRTNMQSPTQGVLQTPTPNVIKEPIVPSPQNSPKPLQQQLQENEQFALAWLRATFEPASSAASRVEQQELYKMYLTASQKTGRRGGVVSPIHFPRCVRTIFGNTVGPNLVKTKDSNGTDTTVFFYVSIRIKANPLPVQYKGVTVPAFQTNQSTGMQSPKSIQKFQPQQSPQQQQQHQQQTVEVIIKSKPEVGSKLKTNKKLQAQQHQLQHQQQQQPQLSHLSQQHQQQKNQLQQQSIPAQHIPLQTQGNQVLVAMPAGKNVVIKKNTPIQPPIPVVAGNMSQNPNNSTPSNNMIVSNTVNTTQQQLQQHQPQQQSIIQNTNIQNTPIAVVTTGNGPPNSSSLIKSLLANKVTAPATSVTETNASAAPNNPSCLITQSINMHQVAQRQHLQKQKELAQQQIIQQNATQPSMALQTTTINALVNNPNIQSTPVKVGQTTIKAIPTNTIIPTTTTIEKKTILPGEANDNSSWDPVPPLAPLSGNALNNMRNQNNMITIGTSNEDSNSTGNNSIASSILSATQNNVVDDCDSSLISFEGLLVPKIKSGGSSVTEEESNSKDSFNKAIQVFNANQMLVDLLDKKSGDPPAKRKLEDELGSEHESTSKRQALDDGDCRIIEDEELMTATPSKNAANLYAEMAASILEDEDLEEDSQPQIPQTIVQKAAEPQKQLISVPMPLQRQIIMGPNNSHQMILSQAASSSQQMPTQATATIKTESGLQTVPLILQKQLGPGGQQLIQPVLPQTPHQTQYMLATNQQGQTYLVAQPQPQNMNQALLVTQTNQQQGQTPTKTIIILQQPGGPPQAVAQQQIIGAPGSSQKVIMTTQQGQQMIVTQVPRPVQHHQLIMNHPNSNIVQTNQGQNVNIMQTNQGQNIVMGQQIQQQMQSQSQAQQHIQIQTQPQQQQQQIQTQSQSQASQLQIQQQSSVQQQIQMQAQTQNQQQLQIQTQTQQMAKPIQHVQIQSTQQQLQQQQQAALLSQLPQIPATIKFHSHQPAVQTQTTQTQTVPKMITQKQPVIQQVQQQAPVTIVAQQQQQQQQHLQQVQQPQQQQLQQPISQPPQQQHQQQQQAQQLQQQAQQIQQQQNQYQQSMSKIQERKQIFVTGSGNIEVTEITQPQHPQATPTPPIMTTPATPVVAAISSPASPGPSTPKHVKTIADIRTDEELVDPNWMWVCDWRGCPRKKFRSLNDVYRHACMVHCPDNLDPAAEIYCQWGPGPGLCDNIPRKRFSLMTHLSDRHCTVESFKAAVQRRNLTGIQPTPHSQPVTIIKNVQAAAAAAAAAVADAGTASPTLSTSSSSSLPSAGSAAMHAIKRHSSDFVNPKELMDENEGPVTKSIRLTASLILRNLVAHTALAKKNIRFYEPLLAGVALSNVESSRTISQILYEMNN